MKLAELPAGKVAIRQSIVPEPPTVGSGVQSNPGLGAALTNVIPEGTASRRSTNCAAFGPALTRVTVYATSLFAVAVSGPVLVTERSAAGGGTVATTVDGSIALFG